MAWPPPPLATNRLDTTPQITTHKDDHNAVNAAMNDTTDEIAANNAAFVRGNPGPTQVVAASALNLDSPTVPVLRDLSQVKYGATGEIPSTSFSRAASIPSNSSSLVNLPTNGNWVQIGSDVSLTGAAGKTQQAYLVIGQVHVINNQGGNPVPANFPTDGDDCRIEVAMSYDASQSVPELGSIDAVRTPLSRFQSRAWPWDEGTIPCVFGMSLNLETFPNPTFRMWARNSVWAGGSAVAQVDLRGCSLQVLELGRSST